MTKKKVKKQKTEKPVTQKPKQTIEKYIAKVSAVVNKHLLTEYYHDAYKKSVLSIMVEHIRLQNKPTTYKRHSIALIKQFGYESLRTIAVKQRMPTSTVHLKVIEMQKLLPYHATFDFGKRKYYHAKFIINQL